MNKSIFYLLLAVLSTVMLAGCYTEKKATKQTEKAYVHYPDMVATKTRQWFPITITGTSVDSSAYKAWLKGQLDADELYFIDQEDTTAALTDIPIEVWEDSTKIRVQGSQIIKLKALVINRDTTIKKLKYSLAHVPPISNIIYRQDSAQMKLMYADNKIIHDENVRLQEKVKSKILWLKIFAGIAAAGFLIAFIIYKTKKKEDENKLKV